MSGKGNKVIFLPSAQVVLEEEAFKALENKNFELALEKLQPLIEYGIRSYAVNTGLLISLINLQRLDDAEAFCDEILNELAEDESDYVDYFDFYMIILYEKGLYVRLSEEINRFLDLYEVPSAIEEKFELLLVLAEEMNQELIEIEMEKLDRAVASNEFELQWMYLHKLKEYSSRPSDLVMEFLLKEEVHPAVKTYILNWLKEIGETREIEVEKFNQIFKLIPKLYPAWNKQPMYERISSSIEYIEQGNPSLHKMIMELVDAYCYVYYPVIPEQTVEELVQAFVYIASNQISPGEEPVLKVDDNIKVAIEGINLAHRVYLTIIPD